VSVPEDGVVGTGSTGTLECVPYARAHSGIAIYGDAYTWWGQAAGRYRRTSHPTAGAVMVLTDYAGPKRGHLAVVRRIVSPREIRIDHANWLDDGAIYVNNPVVDVSAANDWSAVRVWNIPRGSWGTRIYPVQGFIGPAVLAPSRTAQDSPPVF
jgi:surface antigen